jgi:hypothetical protein
MPTAAGGEKRDGLPGQFLQMFEGLQRLDQSIWGQDRFDSLFAGGRVQKKVVS